MLERKANSRLAVVALSMLGKHRMLGWPLGAAHLLWLHAKFEDECGLLVGLKMSADCDLV